MAKNNKRSPKSSIRSPEITKSNDSNSNNAKLVLTIFGLGPIILMIIFLFTKGFFTPPIP